MACSIKGCPACDPKQRCSVTGQPTHFHVNPADLQAIAVAFAAVGAGGEAWAHVDASTRGALILSFRAEFERRKGDPTTVAAIKDGRAFLADLLFMFSLDGDNQ